MTVQPFLLASVVYLFFSWKFSPVLSRNKSQNAVAGGHYTHMLQYHRKLRGAVLATAVNGIMQVYGSTS